MQAFKKIIIVNIYAEHIHYTTTRLRYNLMIVVQQIFSLIVAHSPTNFLLIKLHKKICKQEN